MSNIRFVYFGGEPLGVPVLEELKTAGLLPELIVCSPDKPVGRKQVLTPPPVKVWAEENGIEVFQPTSYKGEGGEAAKAKLLPPDGAAWDVFVVVAYNFILPQWLLNIPEKGVINVHPSLLPKLRGASPIRSAILRDEPDAVGISVMLLDAEMDHGPLLAQLPMQIAPENWPVSGPELDTALAHMGGALLADILPRYISGVITPTEQDHSQATYCGKLSKADSELALDPFDLPCGEAARHAWLMHHAFAGIGGTFFKYHNRRIKITEANLKNNTFTPTRIIPEGKTETDFTTWLATQ